MSVLLHISDTHFGTEQPRVVEALIELAVQQQPDVVVLSGDITQRARPSQFRAAKAFVNRLGAPVLAVPGNHDIALFDLWARLTHPYACYTTVFGTDLEPVHSTQDFMVIGVNTTRAWRHKNGEVSMAQVDRVANLMAKASPQQLRVVVVHQPAALPRAEEPSNLLRGHSAALRAWASAGADLVLGGHIHLPYTLAQQGLARRLWVLQAGTAVSARTRPEVPNSVNILHWGTAVCAPDEKAQTRPEAGKSCLIEQWDFEHHKQVFVRAAVTSVLPERT
jgi:3',5'-cyclic AMP phosphodiesterase CpdA